MKGKELESKKSLSAILRSIKKQETAWQEKIKLAYKLLSKECHFPNKIQIILDWACQELVFNSAHKCYPDTMLKEIWQIISDLLVMSEGRNNTKILSLKASFLEVLMKEFQVAKRHSFSFMQCCRMIFITQEFYKPIAAKYEKFVNFLTNVLNYAQVLFGSPNKGEEIDPGGTPKCLAIYLNLVDILLQLYLKLQKQSSNMQKVTISFNEKLLREIVIWKFMLLNLERNVTWTGVDFNVLLSQSLWNRDNLATIKSQVHLLGGDKQTGEKTSRKFALLDSLFTTVEKCVDCSDDSIFSAMLLFIPELLRTFLDANRTKDALPKHFEFTIFKKFCAIVSRFFATDEAYCSKVATAMKCILELLRILLDYNVFKVNDDTVNTDVNCKFLQYLTREIVSRISAGPPDFTVDVLQCIRYLIDIDRSLFDAYMQVILKELLAFSNINHLKEEDRKLADAKCDILRFAMESYEKTRQIEEFIKELITSIRSTESEMQMNAAFYDRLEEIAMTLPIGQSLSIVQTLLDEMTQNYLQGIEDPATTTLTSSELGNFQGSIRKLNIISEILAVFMLNARITPANGYFGEKQERYVELVKHFYEQVVLVAVNVFFKMEEKVHQKINLLKLVWKLINTLQNVTVYLLHHDLISTPFFRHEDFFEKITLLTTWEELAQFDLSGTIETLYVKGLILFTQQMILISDADAVGKCCTHLDTCINRCLNSDAKSTEKKLPIAATILKEFQWLTSYLGHDSIVTLCLVVFDYVTKHSTADHAESQGPLEDDAVFYYNDAGSREFPMLLSSPFFYDNQALETAFCDLFLRKVRESLKLNFPSHFQATFDKFLAITGVGNSKSVNYGIKGDHGVQPMDLDYEVDQSKNRDKNAEESQEENAEVNQKESRVKEVCNDVMVSMLRMCPDVTEDTNMDDITNDSNRECLSLQTDIDELLKAMNSMNFQWLSAANAAKLLFSLLMTQWQIISLCRENVICVKKYEKVFCILEKFTSSTMTTNRLNVWKFIDPVLLLQCQLSMMKMYAYAPKHPACQPDIVYECIRNVWYLVLNVKRNETNIVIFESLKVQMQEISEKLPRNLPETSVRLLHKLLSVTLEAIQGRIVKKRSLATGLELTYPVIEQLLSANPMKYATVEDIFSQTNCSTFLVLRCYNSMFSICLLMVKSGKDPRFMSLLEDSKLADLIVTTAHVVKQTLIQNDSEVAVGKTPTQQEEVCLEFLQMIFQHGCSTYTERLQTLDFCRPVFSCLCSILDKNRQRKRDRKYHVPYYQIMANFINRTNEIVASHLLRDAVQLVVSFLDEKEALEVHLEFFNFLLTLKSSKDEKRTYLEFLPKFLFLCIEIINGKVTENEEESILVAHRCIVASLGFSKGILKPSVSVASIHCILTPANRLKLPMTLELFLLKVKLLSVLLFNNTNAVFKAIAPFISGVKTLLHELAHICGHDVSPEDAFKACQSVSRLYQEIASHKQLVTQYVPYLVADYLKMVSSNSIPQKCQKCLTDGIYSLMDTCSSREPAYLNMALSQGERELFKDLYNTFTKHHKYQGKA